MLAAVQQLLCFWFAVLIISTSACNWYVTDFHSFPSTSIHRTNGILDHAGQLVFKTPPLVPTLFFIYFVSEESRSWWSKAAFNCTASIILKILVIGAVHCHVCVNFSLGDLTFCLAPLLRTLDLNLLQPHGNHVRLLMSSTPFAVLILPNAFIKHLPTVGHAPRGCTDVTDSNHPSFPMASTSLGAIALLWEEVYWPHLAPWLNATLTFVT
mmetsp:Transcript_31637/g.41807  ORF Transcript_31637/g.41807 Transcript_31637/m.41807 type:complete len:211 (-) Transcript_31637:1711-2343(-)